MCVTAVTMVACGADQPDNPDQALLGDNSATIQTQQPDGSPGETSETRVVFGTFDDVGEGAPQALLEGTLEVQQDCLVIENPEGRIFVPVLARSQIEVSDDELLIAGQRARQGMPIAWGGGFSVAGQQLDVPEECEGIVEEPDQVFMAFTLD